MKMDILAILMVAFGLFAILLFILFYIYARNARNKKRDNEDYEEELTSEEIDKFKNIDKDSDNLIDEDVIKGDIDNLRIKTDNVEDFKEDGSLINGGIIVDTSHEDTIKEETKENVSYDMEEFVPRKKNK